MAGVVVTPVENGARFGIKARPGAPASAIRGVREGRLLVATTAIAEKGKANEAILKLIARTLDVPPSRLKLVAGTSGSLKTIEVAGVDAGEVSRRLNKAANV